jgi:hypothetical protein
MTPPTPGCPAIASLHDEFAEVLSTDAALARPDTP